MKDYVVVVNCSVCGEVEYDTQAETASEAAEKVEALADAECALRGKHLAITTIEYEG